MWSPRAPGLLVGVSVGTRHRSLRCLVPRREQPPWAGLWCRQLGCSSTPVGGGHTRARDGYQGCLAARWEALMRGRTRAQGHTAPSMLPVPRGVMQLPGAGLTWAASRCGLRSGLCDLTEQPGEGHCSQAGGRRPRSGGPIPAKPCEGTLAERRGKAALLRIIELSAVSE